MFSTVDQVRLKKNIKKGVWLRIEIELCYQASFEAVVVNVVLCRCQHVN